jgi:DNA recombination protein RmuC
VEIVLIFCGIAAGALLVWVLMKNRIDPQTVELKRINAGLEAEKKSAADEVVRLRGELEREKQKYEITLKEERKNADALLDELRGSNLEFSAALAREKEAHANLKTQLEEQKGQLEKLQERFTKEFELLANKIFEEKSQKFTDQNRTQLDILLQPLGEKLKDFEKKINDTHLEDTKERASLKEQLAQLHQLNQKMSNEANNLTRALKGEAKTQGDWGEYVLTNILEKSGLIKDQTYVVQQSMTTEDGRRVQPDVIINLPDNKHLIIDSKVSIVAYKRFVQAETEEDRALALKEHVASVRRHIGDLSSKNYQQLYALNSLDFVLLFMPIEPAFAAALQGDDELFNVAFSKNIVIVSPSTLLATLRTVASIWRQEQQNKNAIEIARQSGDLYDKFAGFVEDLQKVGVRLADAQKVHEEALKKLHSGRGNLMNRAKRLAELGAKTSKQLPSELAGNENDAEQEDDA